MKSFWSGIKPIPTLRKKNRLSMVLGLFLMSLSLTSHALEGGLSDGGGNAVGDTLFDFYENQGTEKFDVAQTPAYQKILAPMHAEVEKRLPDFADALRSGLTSKKWLLESKPLNEKACLNAVSLVSVKKTIVACQDEREIRISRSWFHRVNLKNKAGLINHELLINQVLLLAENAEQKGKLEKNARELNRILFQSVLPDEEELQLTVLNLDFGLYLTTTEIRKIEGEVAEGKNRICDSIRGITDPSERARVFDLASYREGRIFAKRANDGQFTSAQRDAYARQWMIFAYSPQTVWDEIQSSCK